MYEIDDYYYKLPKSLISQRPPNERGTSRLLRISRKGTAISHHLFKNIDRFFKPSDILVINDTKVIPGRLIGKKKTGGRVEVLLLDFGSHLERLLVRPGVFKCLVKASKASVPGTILLFDGGLEAIILSISDGIYNIEFSETSLLKRVIYQFGQLPLPPYIRRNNYADANDTLRYQTVYADKYGAIAAPTAGLHITEDIIKRLIFFGVTIVKITLHVGHGTFTPVRVKDIRKHKMHPEWFSVTSDTANTINEAKANGKRVVAVGTTSVRTLEFLAQKHGMIREARGNCNLFIYPGYAFKAVDAMITNFHLPCSTLLMLVSAFSNRDTILEAYKVAIKKKYRFFSYGDAMLID